MVRDGRLHPVHDELDPLLDVGDIRRKRGLAKLHPGTGFVDQIDGLVRQEAVGNEARRGVTADSMASSVYATAWNFS